MDLSQPSHRPPQAPTEELALDETLSAMPPRQTLRPQTQAAELKQLAGLASSMGRTAWQEGLPRLSLGPAFAPESDPATGPDLETRGTLGEGGMGRVLLAWQRSVGREVAVKTIKDRASPDEARLMLLLEGRITGSLEHPGIVPVHALGVSEHGEPLLVTKRIDGTSWRELLSDPQHAALRLLPGGKEDPLRAHLFILSQVCNAVHFAHSRSVVHRDIKPDNVMVGAFGEVYLLDWGIAAQLPEHGELRVTDGALVGTPVYMAPEMVSAAAGPVDARSDVYLLGATLHEVLTGGPRHQGGHAAQVLHVALASLPYAYGDDVPAELAALCQRATSRQRDVRPPSALAFRQAIDTYLHHRGAEQAVAEAQKRLAELRLRRAVPGADRAAVQRLSIECRFAFQLALREWPESADAQAGLADCLMLLCAEALSQERLAEARGFLEELPAQPPERAGRVAALAAELRDKEARAESWHRLAHDQDVRVGARARLLLGVAVVGADLGLRLLLNRTGAIPTIDQLLRDVVIIISLLALGTLIGRRGLLANAISRRFLFIVATAVGLHLVDRLLSKVLGVPVPQVMRTDLLIGLGVLVTAGATVHLMFLPLAGLALVGLLASAWAPGYIGTIFPNTQMAILLGGLLLHHSISGLGAARGRRGAGPGAAAAGSSEATADA